MSWDFIIPAVASFFGGESAAGAAESAANITGAATEATVREQRRQYDENVARQKPFYDVGVNALPELVAASRYTPFSMDQFTADPGYAFRLGEGTKAIERSAAARGGLLSGGTGKALQKFGQDYGSQEYTNAFNRYQLEREARLRPLQSLTGMGQTTSQQLGSAGQTMASNVGNTYMNQGVNQGNALLAGTQARSSAYGDIAKLYGQKYGNRLGGPDNFDPFNQINF
jgi:hypothetical protein